MPDLRTEARPFSLLRVLYLHEAKFDTASSESTTEHTNEIVFVIDLETALTLIPEAIAM